MKLTTIYLDESHLKKFKEYAKKQQRSCAWLIRQVMSDYVKKQESAKQ